MLYIQLLYTPFRFENKINTDQNYFGTNALFIITLKLHVSRQILAHLKGKFMSTALPQTFGFLIKNKN